MAISVVCDQCGKRLNVRDELVGKRLKCPACKTVFTATKVGGAGPTIRVKPKGPKEKGVKVAISWGPVLLVALGVAVVGGIALIYFGPVRAKHAWDPMAAQAESDVKDVVERGLQFHMMKIGEWSPRDRGIAPGVYDVHMLWDLMVMGLPEHIHFKGTTMQGGYTGTYNTQTGEVKAEVEIGGVVVPGSGEVHKKGSSTFAVNGAMKNGDLQVWVNGKKAEIYPTTKPAREKADALPIAPGL